MKSKDRLFLRLLVSSTIITILLACAGCRRESVKESITVAGSTTVLTIAQASAEEFMAKHPENRIFVQGGGSSAGIEAVYTGAAQIGTTSRDLKGEELDFKLQEIPIAYDAIAVIVNRKNPVSSLSKDELKKLYAGEIKNWREVGGQDQEIVLVNRDEASGTREAFAKKILEEADFTKDAVIQPGNGQVRSIVGSTPAAIGYLSLGYANTSVKVIDIDGVSATTENVKTGRYPLQRKLYFLTKGEVGQLTQDFIDFVLSEQVQKQIVSVEFVPIKGHE